MDSAQYSGNLKAFLDEICEQLNKNWKKEEPTIRKMAEAMEAAVSAMQLSGIFRYEFRGDRTTAEVCKGMDAVLKEQLDPASFVTCCLGKLDRQTGDVHLVNAAPLGSED